MAVEYFFDSYALIELAKGNPAYARFREHQVIMTVFNLIEVTNSVFLDFGEEKSKEIYQRYAECAQDLDWDIAKDAIKLKWEHKKRNLSYADCIGYCFALRRGLRFLTGDKEFRDFPQVEFLK